MPRREPTGLPARLALDGELSGFQEGAAHFPQLFDRLRRRRPGGLEGSAGKRLEVPLAPGQRGPERGT